MNTTNVTNLVCNALYKHNERDMTQVCDTLYKHNERDMTLVCDALYEHNKRDVTNLVCDPGV